MRKEEAQKEVEQLRGKVGNDLISGLEALLKTANDPLLEQQEKLFNMRLRTARQQVSVQPNSVSPPVETKPKQVIPREQPKNVENIQNTYTKILTVVGGSSETPTQSKPPQSKQPPSPGISTPTPSIPSQTTSKSPPPTEKSEPTVQTPPSQTPPVSPTELPQMVELKQTCTRIQPLIKVVQSMTTCPPGTEKEFAAVKKAEADIKDGLKSQDLAVIKIAQDQANNFQTTVRVFATAKKVAEPKAKLAELYKALKSRAEQVANAEPIVGVRTLQQAVKDAVATIEKGLIATELEPIQAGVEEVGKLSGKLDLYTQTAQFVQKKLELSNLYNPLKQQAEQVTTATAPESAKAAQEQVKSAVNLINAGLSATNLPPITTAMEAVKGLKAKIDLYTQAAQLAQKKLELTNLYNPLKQQAQQVTTATAPESAKAAQEQVKSAVNLINAGLSATTLPPVTTAMEAVNGLKAKIDLYTQAAQLAQKKLELTNLYNPLKQQAQQVTTATAPESAKAAQEQVKSAVNLINAGLSATTLPPVTTAMEAVNGLKAKIDLYTQAAQLAQKKLELTNLYNPLKQQAQQVTTATAPESAKAAQEQVKSAVNLINAGLSATTLPPVTTAMEAVNGLKAKIDLYTQAAQLAQKKLELTNLYNPLKQQAEQVTTATAPESAKAAQEQVKSAVNLINAGLSATTVEPINQAIEAAKGLQGKITTYQEKAKPPTQSGPPKTTSSQPPNPELQRKLAEAAKKLNLPTEDQTLANLASRPAVANGVIETLESLAELAKTNPTAAAKTRAMLLRELKGGALSGPAPNEKFDAAAKEILASYASHPEVASKALNIAQTAKNPDTVAKGVKVLGPLAKNDFATRDGTYFPGTKDKMVRNALKMGGDLGGDFFERMKTYYDGNKQADANDFHTAGQYTDLTGRKLSISKVGNAYARGFGNAMVGDDGKLAAGPEFEKTRDMLHFHPQSLLNPMPALAQNVEEMKAIISDPQKKLQYDTVLAKAGKPTGNIAKKIVGDTTGNSGELQAGDTKKAVMSAMITPFDQGAVGSCFATAPIRQVRTLKPLEAMEDLTTIATKGTLTKGGTTLPAVTNIAPGENPLMRSWEYTMTTMGARKANSREKSKLGKALYGDFVGQNQTNSLRALGQEHREKVITELNKSFAFTYDPEAERGGAQDGNSSKGAFALQHRKESTTGTTETPITSEEGFKTALREVLLKALGNTRSTEIDNLLGTPAFLTSVKAAFSSGGSPWEWPGGGGSEDVVSLIKGSPATESGLCTPTGTPDQKTKQILVSMIDKFVPPGGNNAPPMANVSVEGIHAMNAMPSNMRNLKGANTEETATKVDQALVTPGTKIATTKLELEKTIYIYEQLMDELIIAANQNDKAGLTNAKENGKPTEGMTPTRIKSFVKGKASNASNDTIDSVLLRELKSPEIVVVDTNWGDAQDHKYFVVAPDPGTGKLTMWEKGAYSGAYKRVEAKWLSSKWEYVA